MSTTSSNQNQKQIKAFYRQRKKNGGGITKAKSNKTKTTHAATLGSDVTQPLALRSDAASPDLQAQDDDYDKEEEMLRQFDMNMAYGPCLGMSRLARWERASRLGLNPPEQIHHLLLNHSPNSNVRSHCLWDSRI